MHLTVLSIICQDGKTPLHHAACKPSVEWLKVLMQHADIAAALTIQDDVRYNVFCIFDELSLPDKNDLFITILFLVGSLII